MILSLDIIQTATDYLPQNSTAMECLREEGVQNKTDHEAGEVRQSTNEQDIIAVESLNNKDNKEFNALQVKANTGTAGSINKLAVVKTLKIIGRNTYLFVQNYIFVFQKRFFCQL